MEARDPLGGASLLVIMPREYKLDEAFATNLGHLRSRHLVVTSNSEPVHMHLGHNMLRLLCKMAGDGGYRKRFQKPHDMRRMWERVGTRCFDYALCIRPDLLPLGDLDRIRSRAKRCFGYVWDGMARFEGTLERRGYFEKLHVFDPADARPSEGMPLLGNFYFDCYPERLPKVDLPPADAYFVGRRDERWPVIDRLCRDLVASGLRPDIQQFVSRSRLFCAPHPYVTMLHQHKPYERALAEALRCRVLLDIHNEGVHGGMSFRVFEALGYGRKLVTTNPLVARQDFYRPANVYSLGLETRTLAEFLAEPMVPVPEDVRRKYGFSAWVRRALDMPAG